MIEVFGEDHLKLYDKIKIRNKILSWRPHVICLEYDSDMQGLFDKFMQRTAKIVLKDIESGKAHPKKEGGWIDYMYHGPARTFIQKFDFQYPQPADVHRMMFYDLPYILLSAFKVGARVRVVDVPVSDDKWSKIVECYSQYPIYPYRETHYPYDHPYREQYIANKTVNTEIELIRGKVPEPRMLLVVGSAHKEREEKYIERERRKFIREIDPNQRDLTNYLKV